jgi:hypothetical protein
MAAQLAASQEELSFVSKLEAKAGEYLKHGLDRFLPYPYVFIIH